MAPDTPERPPYERALLEAPPALVEKGRIAYGCYDTLTRRANLSEVERPFRFKTPRWFKDYRLKEWQAFQFGDDRFFILASLYDAKLMSLVILKGYDRLTNRSFGVEKTIPFSAFKHPDSLYGTRMEWKGKRERFAIDMDAVEGRSRLELVYETGKERFEGSFILDFSGTKPCTVCLPLGDQRPLYSTKLMTGLSGSFSLDGERHEFDPKKSYGMIDDHKGYYPYIMEYDWVMGVGFDAKERRTAFNLTRNQVRDPRRYNENVIWIEDKMYPLPPVTVTRPQGCEGEWIIQDLDGMVDLAFKPKVHHAIAIRAGLLRCDYDGPFGSFSGVITPHGQKPVNVETIFGMGEKKLLQV